MEDILYPTLGYPQHRSTHPRQQGVIICDGVGTRLGYSVVTRAIELDMKILLRVPHLSFAIQDEDTHNFKELKGHWRRNKSRMFRDLNYGRLKTMYTSFVGIEFEHFMPCFKPAWDMSFTIKQNLAGWAHEGMIPFTRQALWSKRRAP